MAFESTGSGQSTSLAEERRDFCISRGEQRILHESFPFLARIRETERKRRIYKMLLVGGRSADEVTLSQVKNAKELEEEARLITSFVKAGTIGKLADAIQKIQELPSHVDFRDYIDNYEEAIGDGVYQLLFNDKIESAIQFIRQLGEGVDCTEKIKLAYFDWKKFGMNNIANKIKEAFPDIDFDSIEDGE